MQNEKDGLARTREARAAWRDMFHVYLVHVPYLV